jgi:predicted phage terminase large subunit-like protein
VSRTAQPSRTKAIPLRPEEVQVEEPDLHAGQLEVFNSKARFQVVTCGRQWGKSTLAAAKIVMGAIAGGDYWWVAPSFPIGELGWRMVEDFCVQIPGARFEGRPVFRITLPEGGTIQLRSADNPDSLRGATLDGVVFDEAAMAKPEAWPTLRPTLSARSGWALFISTPKGLNWFHDIFQGAEGRTGWERWRFPSGDSPYLSAEDIELARQEMSSLLFSQEYLAEFISTGESQFHADWIQHYRVSFDGDERLYILGDEVVPLASCTKFHTVDLAWSQAEDADYTVISSWAVTPKRHLIALDVVRGHFEGPDIVPRLRRAYERWGGHLIVEKATRQMSIIQEAVRSGLPVKVVRAEKDKVARSWPAQARMEQHTVWFPPATEPWYRDFEEELLAFPAGRHDDQVDTLSYAALEVAKGSVYETRGVLSV